MLINILNKKIILSLLLINLVLIGNSALANPEGGNIVDGNASIINTSATRTDINQQSDKVIIDWNNFNIKSNEQVNFNQPSSSSVALNRINDINPSNIAGSITANGKIFLINPNGILFTPTSKIDVCSLFATTSNISNENFKNGNYIFDGQAKDGSSINNQGIIKSSNGGYVILAAPNVINSGSIISNGVTGIYSGNKFVLDYSDNVKVNISSNNPSIDSEVPLVLNSGLIQGQKVYLAAGTENLLIKNAVNTTGIIKATGAKMENGEIVLGEVNIDGQSGKVTVDGTIESDNKIAVNSGDLSLSGELKANDISILADYVYYDGTSDVSGLNGGNFSLEANNLDLFGKIYAQGTQEIGGNVNINVTEKIMSTGGGFIDVSGHTNGGTIKQSASGLFSSGSYIANGTNGTGGTIKIGGSAALLSATLEAKGKTGGGIINIGGDWQGGANLSDNEEKLKQANSAFISSGTNIDASVTGSTGNGGEVVVWSTGETEFYGNINVSQGSASGNGGKVEISGDELTMTEGNITTGVGGNILLDPHNLVISNDSPQAVEAVKLALNYFLKSGTSFTLQDDDSFGTYIALNGSGNIMAVGANGDDTSGYENGALYIFSLNPSDLTQEPYFRYKMVSPVTNTTSYRYAQSIAFNSTGDILAIGAHCDDTGGTDRGAVYLYNFNTTTYVPTYKYKLTSGAVFTSAGYALANSDFFGISVALNATGNILAVGAHGDDNGGAAAGAAYLFTLNTTDLTQTPVLKTKILNGTQGILLEAGDNFGRGISINNTGDILAVGAPADDTNGTDRGAVYLFKLNTSTLVPTQVYTVASGISGVAFANTDNFGMSVSLNGTGNIMAVGVPLQDTGETNGNRGAVRIFTINTDDITQVTHTYKLSHGSGTLALSSADNFGQSVALNDAGNILAVGAHLDDNGGPTRGAVDIFNLNTSDLTQTPTYRYKLASKTTSLEIADFDTFGYSIALNGSGNLLAVGTTEDDIGGTNRGAVYLFSLDPSDLIKDPTFRHKIGSGNPHMTIMSNDQFGSAVALNNSGSVLAIGARCNDTGGGTDRGAVILFSINTSDLTQAPEYKYTVGYTTVTGLSISSGDNFGSSVALNAVGDILAVGAPYSNTGITSGGSVFLFTLNPADLSQSPIWKYKLASGLGITLSSFDWFGLSVALNGAGDILAVGADWDNGKQFGEVYLFTLNTSNLTATPVFKTKVASTLGVSLSSFSNFGCSVALNDTGNILAVGDSFTVTNGMYRGGVYLFNLNISDLTQAPVLKYKLEDGKADLSLGKADYLGSSVALNSSGDILAVGAMLDDTGGNDRGSAYLFSLNTTDLTEDPVKKYKIAEGTKGLSLYNGDFFGISTALNNAADILAVGAYGDNTGGSDRGAVYLFNLDPSDLTKAPILKFKLCSGHGVTLATSDYFGYSVALNATGDLLAVGAIYDDTAGGNAGAVYLFDLDPNSLSYPSPTQLKKFANVTGYTLVAGDQFGVSVALNDTGNILAVGANNDDTGFSNGGAVYLFNLDPSNLYADPVYKYKITNATAGIITSTNEYFGRGVALNGAGDILAVGSPNNDTDGTDKGVVYLFNLDTSDLTQTPQKKFKISGSTFDSVYWHMYNNDYFGTSVALNDTGNILAVGYTGWDFGLTTSIGYALSFSLNTADLTQTPTLHRYISPGYYDNPSMYFGSSIALDASGNIIVVGAYGYSPSGYQRGSLYMYSDIDGWSYDNRYRLKGGSIGDYLCDQSYFGRAIALNGTGNILAVGSVNDNRGFEHTGSVYLFNINPDDITQTPVLGYKLGHGTAGLNLADGDWFGESVALNSAGNILAVGADWDLNNGNNNGEIYLFSLNPLDLTQTPVLKNKVANSLRSLFIDDANCLDFASPIALNGTGDILISYSYRNLNSYVDIISLNPSDLSQTPVLKYEFQATGGSITLNNEGNILAIGNISDNTGGDYAGAVSIYSLNPADLAQEPILKLKLSDGVAGLDFKSSDMFGGSVSLNGVGDKLAVATRVYDIYYGEILLFSLNADDLTQEPEIINRLITPNLIAGMRHSDAISIALNDSGNLLAVGDYGDDALGHMTGAVLLYNLSRSFTDSPSVDRQISANLVSSFLSSGSNVTLQANNDIFLNSAITANNTSGDGGILTLQAGRSIILTNNITSDNGNINIIANETLDNGVIDSNRDSGNAVITMFDNVSINAGTGSVFFDLKEGSDKTHYDSGNITLNNITANDITILNEGLTANSNLIINNNAVLTATGTGTSIVLSSANGSFINNYNSSALNTAGRWLIYSLDNINIVKGGLTGTPMYPGTYLLNSPETISGSDNKFIYADGNFHIVTANNLNKIYGSANPTITYNMSSTDALDTVTGTPVLSVSADENSNAGNYAITASLGTLASTLGYDIVLNNGTLSITPKSLSITADDKTKIYGSVNPAFTANYSGFVLGQNNSALGGALSFSTSADENSKVGNYSITPSGLTSNNYTISFADGVLSIIYDINKVDGEVSSTLSNMLSTIINPSLSFRSLDNIKIIDKDNILKSSSDNFKPVNDSINYFYDPSYLLISPNKNKLQSYLP